VVGKGTIPGSEVTARRCDMDNNIIIVLNIRTFIGAHILQKITSIKK